MKLKTVLPLTCFGALCALNAVLLQKAAVFSTQATTDSIGWGILEKRNKEMITAIASQKTHYENLYTYKLSAHAKEQSSRLSLPPGVVALVPAEVPRPSGVPDVPSTAYDGTGPVRPTSTANIADGSVVTPDLSISTANVIEE